MGNEKECDKHEKLYHFQGDSDTLEDDKDFKTQKKQISIFIKQEVLSKNKNLLNQSDKVLVFFFYA